MISVSTAAYKALYAEELALKLRVRWYLHHSSTGFMDVSDRVSNVSPFTQSSSPFLGGFDLSGFTVTLKNHDRAFSPVNTQTHLQKGTQSYLNTTMEIHQGVLLPDGTWEYIPVAKGYVQRIYFAEDNIEVAVEDAVSLQLSLPMPEEYTIPGWNGSGQLETLEDVVNDLIALSSLDTSILDSTDPSHKDSFGILQDVGWHFAGTVPSGSSIGDILNEVVRSGLCQMIVTEEGKIRFHLEFPRMSANRRLRIDRFPDIIDDTVAFDWQFQQGGRANAT